ncbi:tetratricopeptide repeat protein [Shewanella sp. ALD9]|uniref:tetratricopeptide repeat protein n=1 Tax=Shewanella sp. ALD9 TaxID=2058330 RepID=UPI000C33B283|nr:tetratricopeptide repeat protein [Shewanella sp. ALD9]PKH32632.1 hypothetical protein CXF88_12440 [Shewanella sp. ALD9]
MKTLTHFRLSTVIVVALVSSACSTSQTKREYQPDDQLTAMLKQYNVNQTDGVNCQGYQSAISDCERLSNDLGALSMTYPKHQQIGFTAAIVYHQIGRDVDSQMVLDRLLSQQQPVSEVAILRSKLAMQEGNINLARTVLQRQVQLQPDHPELHATLAASYYLEGRYEKAEAVIATADRLGAPVWRTSYHLGLIHEAQSNWSQACHFYADTLSYQPAHRQSLSRLLYLSDHPECRVQLSSL